MGTRSLTIVKEGGVVGKDIAVLYRQYDGYPEGHGKELFDAFGKFKVINGFGSENTGFANGLNCLFAQIIAHFKTEIGNFYLYPAGTKDCGEEYTYTLYTNSKDKLYLKVDLISGYQETREETTLFNDKFSAYGNWLKRVYCKEEE